MSFLASRRLKRAIAYSLWQESDTDWIPDPWGWRDAPTVLAEWDDDDLRQDVLTRMRVPFLGGRFRIVPVLGSALRVGLMARTLEVMKDVDASLSDSVFAYRLLGDWRYEHYRAASKRRTAWETAAGGENPYVQLLDLKAFFPSIGVGVLKTQLGQLPQWDRLSQLLEWFESQLGYAVPEGYAPARSLANVVLAPVDAVITVPYSRWVDDYHFFCQSEGQAGHVSAIVQAAVEDLGLSVSREKTRLIPWSTYAAEAPFGSAFFSSRTKSDGLKSGLADLSRSGFTQGLGVERRVRFELRRAAESGNGEVFDLLGELEPRDIPVSLIPRIAWAAAMSAWPLSVRRLVQGLLEVEDEFSEWRGVRLCAAVWYAPTPVAQSVLGALLGGAKSSVQLRPVLLRVLARHLPDRLEEFCHDESSPTLARASRLALKEREGSAGHDPNEGPPVRTYL